MVKSIASSTASEVFLDTSGLYALGNARDAQHAVTRRCVASLRKAGVGLVITDFILDEVCTLAKARVGSHVALMLLDLVERSLGIRQVWVGEKLFGEKKAFFRKHADHGYSFTDCTSFLVMRELGLTDALTTDGHFVAAGFRVLLPLARRT